LAAANSLDGAPVIPEADSKSGTLQSGCWEKFGPGIGILIF
jgi:hypothetical protein